ncbi:Retrovirus-related Pol polyprotein from transposon TNT 1-94 [Vitis vinifera]|uniref:Retrovirus-related Pol polyprotein from transposon TNT 1-94 n=1 Tax=Vitis vinifera TaxID=29760 RepID=A0A438IRX3_VITVI|nr:Retrovirus-related Pol polyprotein from transposon TNT 1-94 [Vitis vinifera]
MGFFAPLAPRDLPDLVASQFRLDLYCTYHQSARHHTDCCTALRHAIQDIVDSGTFEHPQFDMFFYSYLSSSHILGVKISRDRTNRKLWLSQESYKEKVLDKFNMGKAKPVSSPLGSHLKLSSKQSPSSEKEKEEMQKVPYASVVGSLLYAMVCTRLDIAHVVGVVNRFLSNPGKEQWAVVEWILRYLMDTSKTCLCFGTNKPVLVGCTDADMDGAVDSKKSTSSYLITFLGEAVS